MIYGVSPFKNLHSTINISASLAPTTMSLLLQDDPIVATACPHLPVNILSRTHASIHHVSQAVSIVHLPVTACFLGQAMLTILPFAISDINLGFEIVLGCQWDSWCRLNKGASLRLCLTFFLSIFSSALSVSDCGSSTSCLL